MLFDIDKLSEGAEPRLRRQPRSAELLRRERRGGGVAAVRVPYLEPGGTHAIDPTNLPLDFDFASHTVQQIRRVFARAGRELADAPCLARHSAPCEP